MKTIASVTYVKAIGIILMVLGHCSCSVPYVTQVLYMFHMPLFFFFSGYCFNPQYYTQPKTFVFRRIKGIYWPYIKWSLIFLLLHNLFFELNVYNEEYGTNMGSDHFYEFEEILFKAYTIITHMTGHEQLLGGYWFMRALFLGSIISFFSLWTIHNISNKWHLNIKYLELLVFLLIVSLSLVINRFEVVVPFFHFGSHPTHAATFFLIGYFFKKYNVKTFRLREIIIAFSFVIFGSFYWRCDMNSLYYDNIKMLPFILTATLGTWSVFSLPWNGGGKFNNCLSFIGKNTLNILTWHFLCFKLVTCLIIFLYALPKEHLAQYPVIKEYAEQGWWLLYFLFGVCVPLFFSYVYNRTKMSL